MKRLFFVLPIFMIILNACTQTDVIMPRDQISQGIHVSGRGVVSSPPDIVAVQIGVQTTDTDAQHAVDENNRKMEKVISAIKKNGVAENDIKTVSFNISPQTDYRQQPPKVIGFRVENRISVTVRDLDKIGEVLQSTISVGANLIHGITFSIDDTTELQLEARAEAIKDARKKAEILAETAGVTLGLPIQITDGYGGGVSPIYRGYDEAVIADAVPIESPGELDVIATVQVVFEIE